MKKEIIPIYDVVIIGAGLSGIGAAYHLQTECPGKIITILEGRSTMGGTWDLFKYPGIRSDSDMYTLGFSFNPWREPKAIADGPSILQYIKDTAAKFGIDKKIQYDHQIKEASWTDEEKMWTLKVTPHQNVAHELIKCNFLFVCSGYYDYKSGYTPEFPNSKDFKGTIIHPQNWDTSLDYTDKKVVIIGSGATAVTLVPELAKKAQKVTMLQRSPTYIVNVPSEDPIANFLRERLPAKQAYQLTRWKNILLSMGIYNASRQWPLFMKNLFKRGVKRELGSDFDMKHFDPKYNPWDQRLCMVPDADLFVSIREGKADVVTDTIEEFTPKGILLSSGQELEADIIVTATGLVMQLLGGMNIKVNGQAGNTSDIKCYRGVMFSDVPNFAITVGYTNASWTLKCDLNCHYVTRVINYMDKHDYTVCTPRFDSKRFDIEPLLAFDSGYVKRAESLLPKQGSKAPWKVYQNYVRDMLSIRYGPVNDRYLDYK